MWADPRDRSTAVQAAVEQIARNLRRWRVTRGMTVSALADHAGVAKSTVSLIERGQGNPSIDTVWSLASALGVPFASLFHDGAERHANARASGLFEHITVATGTVEISTDSFSEIVGQGDLISFRADRPHSYRVLEGPVRLVSVHEYPSRPSG
jgi:XRE family transcriptional regulator, regulator of sulfur utilization